MNKLFSNGDISGLPECGLAVVGFSGGADSTALAHWLMGQIDPKRIVLAHINHMLRGSEADRDQLAAEEFAKKHGLRFELLRVDVAALAEQNGMGHEECGRAVRYEFFEKLAAGDNDRILTAHNANDNAETMLLNLCRGTGLDGLCGIPYRRGKIVRPLLKITRVEIEQYCEQNGLPYVTDSSNLTDEYARNKIRHSVMPVLCEMNPKFIEAATQTAQLLNDDRESLARQAEELLARAEKSYGLDCNVLKTAEKAVLSRALRIWLEQKGCGRLEKKHIDEACACVEFGGAVQVSGGVTVRAAQNTLSAMKESAAQPFCVNLHLPTELDKPEKTVLCSGKVLILEKKRVCSEKSVQKIHNLLFKNALDYDIITNTLTARTRREGDRFAPAGGNVTKSLKRVFQDCGMPTALRKTAVLLECGGTLAWCEGAGAAREFAANKESEFLLTVSVLNEKE